MGLSEEKLKETIRKEEAVSSVVRHRLDETYEKILNEPSLVKRKPRVRRQSFYVLVAVLMLLVITTMTPIGLATMNLLRFGEFTSERLKQDGFVKKGPSVAIDQKIEIKLLEHYADSQTLGLHFSIHLPKNSTLLSSDLEDYHLKFSIENQAKQTVIHFNSNKQVDSTKVDPIQSVQIDYSIDRATRTLELTYRLNTKDMEELPDLDDATLIVESISANQQQELKQGENKLVIKQVSGKWEIPLKQTTSQFPPIPFYTTEDLENTTPSALAYPTSFVVTISEEFLKQTAPKPGEQSFQLQVNEQGKSQSYLPKKTKFKYKEGQKFLELTFGYLGYDQNSEVLFVIEERESILLASE